MNLIKKLVEALKDLFSPEPEMIPIPIKKRQKRP